MSAERKWYLNLRSFSGISMGGSMRVKAFRERERKTERERQGLWEVYLFNVERFSVGKTICLLRFLFGTV